MAFVALLVGANVEGVKGEKWRPLDGPQGSENPLRGLGDRDFAIHQKGELDAKTLKDLVAVDRRSWSAEDAGACRAARGGRF